MKNFEIISEDYYSNCIIEAIKAKIKNPNIKLIVCMPWENEVFCPHVMWSDGIFDYDFGNEGLGDQGIQKIKNWTIHIGHLRRWELGEAEKYKDICKKWAKRHPRKRFVTLKKER